MSSSRSKGLNLLACAALHSLNHALQVILPPLYLSIKADFGLDLISKVMILGSAYLITYAAVSIPYGIVGDRVNRKLFLVLGAMLNSAAFLLAAAAGSYPVFIVAMVLAGLGGGVYHPLAGSLIASIFKGTEGRAFGFIGMGAGFGLFIGPFASGMLGQQFGWRATCTAFAVTGCLVTMLFAAIMPREEKPAAHEVEQSALPMRTVLIAALPLILVGAFRDFSYWGVMFLTPAMTEIELGFSKQAAGSLIGFMNLTGIVAQPLMGSLSDRIGRRRLIGGALFIAAICVGVLPYLRGVPIFIGCIVAGFMMLGSIPPLDAAVAQSVPPLFRSRIYGVMVASAFLFGSFAPSGLGLVHDVTGNYHLPYLLLGGAILVSSLLCAKLPQTPGMSG